MACIHVAPSRAEKARVSLPPTDAPSAALELIWKLTRDQIYPPGLVATHFSRSTFLALREQTSTLDSVQDLPGVINPFLDSLGVSHTQVYAKHSLEYAFFRSLFSTKEPDDPPFSHIGVQLLLSEGRWWIREALDGFPAQRAGLGRGDELLALDGEAFDARRLCDAGERRGTAPHAIGVKRRSGERVTVSVPCVRQNPHASMHQAIANSVRRFTVDGQEIGYLRLWTGTGARGLQTYREAIAALADTDALILDLRGGFGGAWYPHLDPFFPDRRNFFAFTVINRDGSTTYDAEPHQTKTPYTGPMVALINEGTRSGKEAVAFQLRKSARATLIGTTTRGAFSAGKGVLTGDDVPLVFYLAVAEYRLDGHRIEGVGVSPDIRVSYPVTGLVQAEERETTRYDGADPQVAAALEHLEGVLTRQTNSE